MCSLGEKYAEAVSPALGLRHWYSMFFISCQLIGSFFMTALLIEAFCASYEKNHTTLFKTMRLKKWRSLILMLETCYCKEVASVDARSVDTPRACQAQSHHLPKQHTKQHAKLRAPFDSDTGVYSTPTHHPRNVGYIVVP